MTLTHMDDRFPQWQWSALAWVSVSDGQLQQRLLLNLFLSLQETKHWCILMTVENLRLLVIFKGSIQ